MAERRRSLVILGSGPAGLTAAIYAARADLKPLLVHGAQPGGQLTTTTIIENFPGFPEGLDGPELMANMEEQARHFGTEFLDGEVTAVDLGRRPFALTIGDEQLHADALVISTGASPRMLGLENEWKLMGKGVSVCATCDGFFFRDRKVVVVGGGDTALEEALFLTRFASQVTVVHRRAALRATIPLQQKANASDRLAFAWDSVVSAILADQKGVTGVEIENVRGGEKSRLDCDGLFIAIGHTPNTGLFKGQLELDAQGYIRTHNQTETDIPGVFAAGDVQDPHFRQAITAAGSGCAAAMQAERYLEGDDP